jgi:hypothetical protein
MSIFTAYVRGLGRGEPPTDQELALLWRALRDAVRAELRRRRLWYRPPSYLGVFGWQSWAEHGDRVRKVAGAGRQEALDELTAECYVYVFVDRLRSLEAQLRVKPDIEGLVVLSVHNFIHDCQRMHDPLGFHVFEVVRAAVRAALGAGDLCLLGGDPRIRNATVLGFSARAASRPPGLDLSAFAARWIDELLPSLMAIHGKRQKDAIRRLAGLLPELSREGIEAFRFGDLVEPLKHVARTRWSALFQQSAGDVIGAEVRDEANGAVRVAPPDTRAEECDFLDHMNRQMAESLNRLQTDERTRRELTSLWDYMSRSVSPYAEIRAGQAPGRPAIDEAGRFWHRQAARELKIPRDRLRALLTALGQVFMQGRTQEEG